MASRGQQLWQFMAVCGYYSVTDKSLYFLVLKKRGLVTVRIFSSVPQKQDRPVGDFMLAVSLVLGRVCCGGSNLQLTVL